MMSQWQFQQMFSNSVKNWASHVNSLLWNSNQAVGNMYFLFSMDLLTRLWRGRISISKNLTIKRLMMFKSKERMRKNLRNRIKWLMIFKLIKKMNLMIRNKLEQLLLIRINRLFTLLSVKMIGNSNAKELPTNLKYKPKVIINSGEPELNPQEQPLSSLRKSNYKIIQFPQYKSYSRKT